MLISADKTPKTRYFTHLWYVARQEVPQTLKSPDVSVTLPPMHCKKPVLPDENIRKKNEKKIKCTGLS
jgi:hypothetical protein